MVPLPSKIRYREIRGFESDAEARGSEGIHTMQQYYLRQRSKTRKPNTKQLKRSRSLANCFLVSIDEATPIDNIGGLILSYEIPIPVARIDLTCL